MANVTDRDIMMSVVDTNFNKINHNLVLVLLENHLNLDLNQGDLFDDDIKPIEVISIRVWCWPGPPPPTCSAYPVL